MDKRGMALISAFISIVVVIGATVGLSSYAINTIRSLKHIEYMEAARYAALAGLETVRSDVYKVFYAFFRHEGWKPSALAWFDGLLPSGSFPASAIPTYSFPMPVSNTLPNGASYTVRVVKVLEYSGDWEDGRDVVFEVVGEYKGVKVKYESSVRYAIGASHVFEYVYFSHLPQGFAVHPSVADNVFFNGDIRSNGALAIYDSVPWINGSLFAATNPEFGPTWGSGEIYEGVVDWSTGVSTITGPLNSFGKYQSLVDYWNETTSAGLIQARPTNPSYPSEDLDGDLVLDAGEDVNGNGVLDLYDALSDLPAYTGKADLYKFQEPIFMPFLGDSADYEQLAHIHHGKITDCHGTVLVNEVYNGNLILEGTNSCPIKVDGPVYVSGDVIIKGVFTGQGTIYARRNVHIVGDIVYKDPPVWDKPDPDPTDNLADSLNKDFLGLVAWGNVVIGDYTEDVNGWWTWYESSLQLSAGPYYVEDDDRPEYKTGFDAAVSKYYFHGDYTQYDGGQKVDSSGTPVGPRRYFEASIDDAWFDSIAEPWTNIHRIDAYVYSNHAVLGVCNLKEINGVFVARHHSMLNLLYVGDNVYQNQDIRGKYMGNKFYLPKDARHPIVLYIRRVH